MALTRYLLDTGIASDLINQRNGVLEKAVGLRSQGHVIGLAMPVVAELAHGIEASTSCEKNRELFLKALGALRVWPFDLKAALEYGRIRAELTRIGRPIQAMDIQIAAIALTLGRCVLVTKDSDFGFIPGLVYENWVA